MGGTESSIRLRRALVLVVSAVVPLLLVTVGGHRGVHMARNLLVPGAGIVDHEPWLALVFAALAIAATVIWLSWGSGWLVLAVVIVSTVLSGVVAGTHIETGTAGVLSAQRSAHEFPLVILVIAALGWLRSVSLRIPGLRTILYRPSRTAGGLDDLASLRAVDRGRAASLAMLAGSGVAVDSAWADDVRRRARMVGVVARLRVAGDPFRRDHAAARTAQLLGGAMAEDGIARFAADAQRCAVGVPCSEPSWVRPLDATLAALALQRVGEQQAAQSWETALRERFVLRRGHRAAWWWTPLDLGAGAAPAWEHAAFTGLSRAAGWIDSSDDWGALRRRALGAAARGALHPADERLVAAARIWLVFVDDPEAERIVSRPGIRRDPVACALDLLARTLRENRGVLRHGGRSGNTGGQVS